MRLHLFTSLVFLCLFPLFLHALPQVQLNQNNATYTDFLIEKYIEDSDSPQNIHTVKDLPFTKISNRFTLGYHQTPLWLRFSVHNSSSKKTSMILEVSEPFHKTAELYTKEKHIKNGLSVPLEKRSIKEYNPSFTLNFIPLETKIIYLKLESTYGLFGSVQLKTPEIFYADTKLQNNFMIFYFGAVLIIALYNLFIFFYLRESIYLYYVGYVLFFATWASLYSGFASSYFDMKAYDLLQVSVPAFVIMLTLFSQSMLQTKHYFHRIHYILNIFIILTALSLVWMLVSLSTGFYLMNIVVTPLLPTLLFTSIYASLKGHKLAKIYTLALITYIISISMLSLLALGFVPYSSLVRNAPIIGSLIEIVLFSLALAYRINLLRQEKLDSQAMLLLHEQTESSRLVDMVEQKTAALKEANEQLEIQASTDFLTGILNRKAFFRHCSNEVERVKRYPAELSFLIVDIDLFKSVNDTYGHLAGDDVLIAVTDEISLQLRNTDIFGRIGGEEFALLMPNTTMEDALQLAERIRKSVSSRKIIADGTTLPISISIGVSEYKKGEDIIQLALRRADQALYKAKENGRNQVMEAVS